MYHLDARLPLVTGNFIKKQSKLKVEELRSDIQISLFGRSVNDHFWAFVFVEVHPLSGMHLLIHIALPLVFSEPFLAHSSAKFLEVGILLGLSRLNAFQLYTQYLAQG